MIHCVFVCSSKTHAPHSAVCPRPEKSFPLQTPVQSTLAHNLINPPLLHPPYFLLESLDLAPAIQWSPVVIPQAPHQLAAGLLHTLRDLPKLSAFLELRAQCPDLLGNCGMAGLDGVGGFVGRRFGGELLLGLTKGFGLLGTETLQLGGNTGLDLELDGLLAGCIGLRMRRVSCLLKWTELWLGSNHLWAGLQGLD